MSNVKDNSVVVSRDKNVRGCLSCGTTENMTRRKYCSIECRQRLRYNLNMRTGLLKALNTRYATFYFTKELIVMDVLPYGSKDIYSFIYPRKVKSKPVDDFRRMADMLGNAWWAERRRTNRKYLASLRVFEQAHRNSSIKNPVKPMETKIPSIKSRSLIHLKLGKSELESPELLSIIKKAYRTQAKKHHPDHGGNSTAFRQIQQAYQELLNWAESPSFIRRRGFPDKWFYDGINNRWVQPTPHRHISYHD